MTNHLKIGMCQVRILWSLEISTHNKQMQYVRNQLLKGVTWVWSITCQDPRQLHQQSNRLFCFLLLSSSGQRVFQSPLLARCHSPKRTNRTYSVIRSTVSVSHCLSLPLTNDFTPVWFATSVSALWHQATLHHTQKALPQCLPAGRRPLPPLLQTPGCQRRCYLAPSCGTGGCRPAGGDWAQLNRLSWSVSKFAEDLHPCFSTPASNTEKEKASNWIV